LLFLSPLPHYGKGFGILSPLAGRKNRKPGEYENIQKKNKKNILKKLKSGMNRKRSEKERVLS
jgi:hypothetical protein